MYTSLSEGGRDMVWAFALRESEEGPYAAEIAALLRVIAKIR